MSDIEFIPGLIVKAPSDKAPEYVKAKLSIKRAELLAWLESQTDEWINAEVKVSRNGKWYCQRDSWKPNQGERQESRKPAQSKAPPADSFEDDSTIPF
jgi:hypothetical protein